MMRRVTRVVVVLCAVIIEAFVLANIVHTLGSPAPAVPKIQSVAFSTAAPCLQPESDTCRQASNPNSIGVVAPVGENPDGSVRVVQGNGAAIRVEMRQISITKVLA